MDKFQRSALLGKQVVILREAAERGLYENRLLRWSSRVSRAESRALRERVQRERAARLDDPSKVPQV